MNPNVTILRRYAECMALVFLWMACGFYFHLGVAGYQTLGIAFVIVFQLAVARRPLAQLWVREADRFRLDGKTWAVATGLFVASAALLLLRRGTVGASNLAPLFVALLAVGAIPAAFALRSQRAGKLRAALPFMLIAIAGRLVWRVGWAPTWAGDLAFPLAKLPDFFADALAEFIAGFVIEEVAFRGALDGHLAAASAGRLHAWSSAIFVSMLWSVWHLPVTHPHAKNFWPLFADIGLFGAILWGPMLAFCARRSRTLVPSAAIHAAGNACVLTLMR